jgi:hypothetical protein
MLRSGIGIAGITRASIYAFLQTIQPLQVLLPVAEDGNWVNSLVMAFVRLQ